MTFASCLLVAAFAGQDVASLTSDERIALAAITQNRVRSTVAFLASDEMKGRQTPSPELNIAAAYVKSRLQAAGLEGLGPDGSFYQESFLDMHLAPKSLTYKSETGTAHCALFGGNDPVEFQGSVPKVENRGKVAGPVWLKLSGRRSAAGHAKTLSRSAAYFRNLGATALLVVVEDPEHALIEYARAGQSEARQTGAPIPVILVSSPPSGECSLEVPAGTKKPVAVRNVVAIHRGSDPELAREAIIFTAHLDHIGVNDTGTDRINNGADDDASGVTAVLSLADAYAALKVPPKRSTIFMTFWGEEKGLRGSRYYCQHPLWPLQRTVANINIEMVGRPEPGADNKAWMTGWDKSDLGELMAKGSTRAGVTVFNHKQNSPRLYRASDNYSFVETGVIAHSFSAGSLHSDYHRPTDEWEKLKIPHMTQVIQGLFAGSLPIARGQFTPKRAR